LRQNQERAAGQDPAWHAERGHGAPGRGAARALLRHRRCHAALCHARGYFDPTGDIETIAAIWPNIKAALQWIDTLVDADGESFVEYARQNLSGLVNQGWKDSYDSIFHADGALAEGPIALCEVQGYVFGAKARAAKLAHRMGEDDFEIKLRGAARFNPISYPDGAVWPHDNAMIVLGLARYGFPWHAAQVFAAIPPPAFLDYVTLHQLSLGKLRLDLRLHRHGRDVPLNLLRR
jgi:glycogen debranching enzyme